MTPTDRLGWLDCLRLTAGLSMLILHCTADPKGGAWAQYDTSQRVMPLVLRTIAYAARTELFIIISLFLLLMSLDRRPRGYGTTILDQMRRLLIPFAFWTLFYAGFSLIKAQSFGYFDAKLAALGDPMSWLGFVFLGSSKYHMHFLPTLFCVVLAYPVMRKAIDVPLLGAIALIVCLITRWQLDAFFYPKFWDAPEMPFIARGVKIATHVGYGMVAASCLGLWQRMPARKAETWLPVVLYLAALLLAFKFLATWRTIETGAWDFSYLPGYWADFLMPALLFTICMILGHRVWSPVFSRLAKYAFGLYLCHPIFLDFCEIGLRALTLAPWQQVLLKISVTLVATSGFVLLLARSSLFAWTIGLGAFPKFTGLWPIARKAS